MIDLNNTEIAFKHRSDRELRNAKFIFTIAKNDTLSRIGIFFLELAHRAKLPVKRIIRKLLFNHFCGGENINECTNKIEFLSKRNVNTILQYATEGKNTRTQFDDSRDKSLETLNSIKEIPEITFIVVKMSGISSHKLLKKITSDKKLSETELAQRNRAENRLRDICVQAKKNNVSILIDAEESWIQGAIDHFASTLMQELNTNKAWIYNTFQLYRTDRLNYLKQSHKQATENNFILGCKLVRGAYMDTERERALLFNYKSPIHLTKKECDDDFNSSIDYCLENTDSIATCLGTHNEQSSEYLTQIIAKNNIDKSSSRVVISQLLGMSDHITFNMARQGYNVAKFIPYGPVEEVIPYLIRRAKENKSVLNESNRELEIIIKEIERRKRNN
ncbi:MAG: proline dehydrogenase family protein [Flavobacteriales bacterium]|nr:proline dehydrogenase family protein [Flavobacteriales bacterium]